MFQFARSISRAFTTVPNIRMSTADSNRPMYSRMLKRFKEEFQPTHMDIVDESTLHAEHAAMRDVGYNETHFRILIVSDKFAGKLPVQRHRMVYNILEDEFKQGLHAVNIVAKTPPEYAKQ